ncbi:hypothetical protein V6N12_017411 [Hibiscus sabdariffa]|uniref:Uncharacterized protein n=1 Tax=Hibiscus sabdariffa TaxID=183260 RepID=A0ABR2CFF5_9ROSI
MAEDGLHAGDSIQGPVPKDLGFEFGLLCVGSVGEHLSERKISAFNQRALITSIILQKHRFDTGLTHILAGQRK